MFKVGDKVIDSQRGQGEVINILDWSTDYLPVVVRISTEKHTFVRTYTLDGKYNSDMPYCALFHLEDYVPPSAAEPKRLPELDVDTPMLVRKTNRSEWKKRHFYNWDEDGNPECFAEGTTSWSGERLITWREWKLPEEHKQD